MKILEYFNKRPTNPRIDKKVKSFLKNESVNKFEIFTIKDFDDVKEALRKTSENYEKGFSQDIAKELYRELEPKYYESSVINPKPRPESDMMKFKFMERVNIANNPDYVFYKMNKETLNKADIESLEAFHPDYYRELVDTLINEISEYFIKNDDKELSITQELVVNKILKLPPTTIDTMKIIKALHDKQTQNEPTKKGRSPKKDDESKAIEGTSLRQLDQGEAI